MSRYIATFHTHLSALLTCQSLTACGAAARMRGATCFRNFTYASLVPVSLN